MKKTLISMLVATSVIASVISMPLNVYANTNDNINIVENNSYNFLSESEVIELLDFFTSNGVENSKAIELIGKVDSGVILNSMDENFADLGILTIEEMTPTGELKQVYTYPDGSIKVNEVYRPETVSESIRSVSGGSVSSGSGWMTTKGARVYASVGVATCWFYADYTFAKGGYDKITRIYDASINTIGGTYHDATLGNGPLTSDNNAPDKANENASGAAYAKLSFKFDAYSGAGSQTCWMKLNVGGDNAWSTTN